MTEIPEDEAHEKANEVLRRLLKTPPDHRAAKKPVNRSLTKQPTK
jgi:hypothetical protein